MLFLKASSPAYVFNEALYCLVEVGFGDRPGEEHAESPGRFSKKDRFGRMLSCFPGFFFSFDYRLV
jgi:hypothetical protein